MRVQAVQNRTALFAARAMRVVWLSLLFGIPARAAVTPAYEQIFEELSAMVDAAVPQKVMPASVLGVKCFSPGAGRLDFHREQFVSAQSQGRAAVSGLFLAVYGDAASRLLVRGELENNSQKRAWLWRNFGTEKLFFWQIRQGARFQSLTQLLPFTEGLRAQIRLLLQSKDPLIRRAGLFFGSWLADDGYRWGAQFMASSDADPVNRECARRLLPMIP